MSVLICGFMLFGIAFFLHVALWRTKKPTNTIKALVALFGIVLLAGMASLIMLERIYPGVMMLPHELVDYLYIVIFFSALFMAYLVIYPAIEVDSPSLVISLLISRSGNKGVSAETIKELFGDNFLVEPRLKDLVDSRIVDLTESVYKINRKGMLFIWPFIIYRRFLKLGKGG